MTNKDLLNAGIVTDGKLADGDFGLLVLKYCENFYEGEKLNFFKNLEEKIMRDYNIEEFDSNPQMEKKFLEMCLAVSDKEFQKAYISSEKDNVKAILIIHDIVARKKAVEPSVKENIRAARRLAEDEDKLVISSKIYKESKESLESLMNLKKDEASFDSFCNIYKSANKEVLKMNLEKNLTNALNEFLKLQNSFFSKYTNHYLREDARFISFSSMEMKANA